MNFELLFTIVLGVLIANYIIKNPEEIRKLISSLIVLALLLIGIGVAVGAGMMAYDWIVSITYQDISHYTKGLSLTGFIVGSIFLFFFLGPWAGVLYALNKKDNITSLFSIIAAIGMNVIVAKIITQL